MKTISLELSRVFNNKKTKLIVEPGAALIASPVSFLCEVVDVKDTYSKRIVTINGSRNNIDPLMSKTNYFLEIEKKEKKETIEEQIICGYTCMENDRLMKLIDKEELVIGDKLTFIKLDHILCVYHLYL